MVYRGTPRSTAEEELIRRITQAGGGASTKGRREIKRERRERFKGGNDRRAVAWSRYLLAREVPCSYIKSVRSILMAISPRALNPYAGLIFIKGPPPPSPLADSISNARGVRRAWVVVPGRVVQPSDFLTALLIVTYPRACITFLFHLTFSHNNNRD